MTRRDITTAPILPCRGGECPPERPARHRFTRFSERFVKGGVEDIDVVYRCDDCGHERTWGSIDPPIFRALMVH